MPSSDLQNDLKNAFKRHKKGAAKRKIAYNLSLDVFERLWQKPCQYCGTKRPKSYVGGWIDRVDSAEGYERTNCVPCCFECNTLKNIYPPEILPLLAYYQILHKLKRKGEFSLFCHRIIQRSLLGKILEPCARASFPQRS